MNLREYIENLLKEYREKHSKIEIVKKKYNERKLGKVETLGVRK